MTWGDADCGGDSSAVRDQLKDVQHIHATAAAFAAILADGSVVTWGDAGSGGDSSAVRDQLRGCDSLPRTAWWRKGLQTQPQTENVASEHGATQFFQCETVPHWNSQSIYVCDMCCPLLSLSRKSKLDFSHTL